MRASVFRFAMENPSDISSLVTDIERGIVDLRDIRAIIVKTEGNGSATDYSVLLAERTLRARLCELTNWSLDEFERHIALFVEGGSEGVISPHGIVLSQSVSRGVHEGSPRLAFGVAFGDPVDPYEIGNLEHADHVAGLVKEAITEAGIQGVDDVQCVIVATPTPSLAQIQRLEENGQRMVSSFPETIAAASRRAAAAGVAMTLEEGRRDDMKDGLFSGHSIVSNKAMVITKALDAHLRVLVLGKSVKWEGSLSVSQAIMHDAIDVVAVRQALHQLGLPAERPLRAEETRRVAAVFAKAEADPLSRIRGRRTVMMEDADIHHTRHIRSVVGAVLAAAIGHPQVFVSAGAESQGPVGGGPICIIGEVE